MSWNCRGILGSCSDIQNQPGNNGQNHPGNNGQNQPGNNGQNGPDNNGQNPRFSLRFFKLEQGPGHEAGIAKDHHLLTAAMTKCRLSHCIQHKEFDLLHGLIIRQQSREL
ncbi:hypothetical protein E6O75_ATG06164 [Venturia nashicola]|uniref:Uncharacterized protein n=1 Tax=Venturia nashicola TaxID=86259 RepID=A0A4Z1PD26_9PEZI|nr:hypothetical protein E6O75_ATG06164 [Venturia nashicola]